MLERFQLDVGLADKVDGLHETLHALPHVHHGGVLLLGVGRRERDLVIVEDLHDVCLADWVFLELELVHLFVVRVGQAQRGEKLADDDRLGPLSELL